MNKLAKLIDNLSEKDLNWWQKDFVEAYEDTDKDKDQFLDVAEKAGMITGYRIPDSDWLTYLK